MNRIKISDIFNITGRGKIVVYKDLPINHLEIRLRGKIRISSFEDNFIGIMSVDAFEMITYRSPEDGKPHKGAILVSWVSGQVDDSVLKGEYFEKHNLNDS